jgi:soluble lytic murein transglycosylase-like protein
MAPVSPGFAADPAPWPDFTFKMSKPPKAGTTKRITVQIEPQPPKPKKAASVKQDAETVPMTPTTATYAWYWNLVPPELGVSASERNIKALSSLAKGPGGGTVPGPRLQVLQGIALSQGATILRETIGTQVSPALVLAVIAVESSGKSAAESHKGAQGLMQLMPDTAKRFGVTDSLDTAQNIKGGVAYLDWLMGEFGGDPVLALAGYNAGEGAVHKHGGVPPYAETRDYVPKVLAAFEVARGLCKTRPELITDACALNLALN